MTQNEKICAGVPAEYRKHAVEILEQLDFMQQKLERSRQAMGETDLIYFTVSTKGKRVPKRNPFYDEYNALMRTYNSTIELMRDLLGSSAGRVKATPGNLIKFEQRFKKAQ